MEAKAVRLTAKEEYTKMLPSSNSKNIKQFNKLLDYFFYSTQSKKKIINNCKPITTPYPDNYLDKRLNLNSQKRAWYKVKNCAEEDKAYKKYLQEVLKNTLHEGRKDTYLSCVQLGIFKYKTFVDGYFIHNKQKVKLFKFLLNEQVISSEAVESITTSRTSDSFYLCISRNPVDYLFVSTNQNFTSCLNLESTYNNAFYMGLGSLNLDPNRVLIFTTSGKIRRYTIKGYEFKHFSYTNRAWSILMKGDIFYVLRPYPDENFVYKNILDVIGIKSKDSSEFKEKMGVSKFKYSPAFFEDGMTESHIYYDYVGICQEGDSEYRYNLDKGREGGESDFSWSRGFERLEYFDDLMGPTCCNCGDHVGGDDAYTYGSEYYCESCYYERFAVCDICGATYDVEDLSGTTSDSNICSYCADNLESCSDCGLYIVESPTHIDGDPYCDRCCSRIDYIECYDCCENTTSWTEIDGNLYCDSCSQGLEYIQCYSCSEYFTEWKKVEHRGEMVTMCLNCASEAREAI